MDFKNQRILVVGGAGFIGSHLADKLAEENPKALHVVDNLFLGKEENLVRTRQLYPSLGFHRFDATEGPCLRDLIHQERIDVVFNLATKALGYSFDDPRDAFHVNVQIAGHLLESLRLKEIKRLIHFSSSEAYGTALKVPMGEDHPLLAHTPYAAGKAAADLLIRSYQQTFGVSVLTLRPFNNYGPRQNEGSYAGVIPVTIKRLLGGKAPIINGDGLQTRDFIYVGDTVRLALLLAKREDLAGQTINLGTGREITIREIVESLCYIAGYTGRIEKGHTRLGDVRRHCADVSFLQSLVGELSLQSFDESLARTWEWYRCSWSSKEGTKTLLETAPNGKSIERG